MGAGEKILTAPLRLIWLYMVFSPRFQTLGTLLCNISMNWLHWVRTIYRYIIGRLLYYFIYYIKIKERLEKYLQRTFT